MTSPSTNRALRRAAAPVLATASLLAAGCGSTPPTSDIAVLRPSASTLTRGALERELGAGVRAALGRVAVMQQPKEGAADLGQQLPEGLVHRVQCAVPSVVVGKAPQRRSTCDVAWRTADGAAKHTTYAVDLRGGPCFAAHATPALPALHDATIQTYAEHPLNQIFSLERGC